MFYNMQAYALRAKVLHTDEIPQSQFLKSVSVWEELCSFPFTAAAGAGGEESQAAPSTGHTFLLGALA